MVVNPTQSGALNAVLLGIHTQHVHTGMVVVYFLDIFCVNLSDPIKEFKYGRMYKPIWRYLSANIHLTPFGDGKVTKMIPKQINGSLLFLCDGQIKWCAEAMCYMKLPCPGAHSRHVSAPVG